MPIAIRQEINLRAAGRTITQQVHQPKDIRPHSYMPITFTQQVSRRTDGRTHTDSSPLGNESA